MPKNLRGGTGHKKRKNKPTIVARKPTEIAKDFDPIHFEVYGKINKAMGNRRFEVSCQKHDDYQSLKVIICALKGSIRKRINKYLKTNY